MGHTTVYAIVISLIIFISSNVYAQTTNEEFNDNRGNIQLDFDRFDIGGGEYNPSTPSNDGWVVSGFIDTLTLHTYNFVKKTYDDVAQMAHGYFIFFTAIWAIYIIVTVFFLRQNTPPLNILMQLFLIMVASSLLTVGGSGSFFAYFYEPFVLSSVKFSSYFIDSSAGGEGSFTTALSKLENLFKNTFKISGYMIDSVDRFDIGGWVKAIWLSLVLILSVSGLVFLFAAYWAYAIFALHILFAFTPIMIVLYPFKALRQFPEKWFGGVINYLVMPVVLSISMGITILVYESSIPSFLTAEAPEFVQGGASLTGTEFSDIIYIVLISILSFLVHLRVGDISAHLTGGISTGLGATWAVGINAMANVANVAMQQKAKAGEVKRSATRSLQVESAKEKLMGKSEKKEK